MDFGHLLGEDITRREDEEVRYSLNTKSIHKTQRDSYLPPANDNDSKELSHVSSSSLSLSVVFNTEKRSWKGLDPNVPDETNVAEIESGLHGIPRSYACNKNDN